MQMQFSFADIITGEGGGGVLMADGGGSDGGNSSSSSCSSSSSSSSSWKLIVVERSREIRFLSRQKRTNERTTERLGVTLAAKLHLTDDVAQRILVRQGLETSVWMHD